MLLPFYILHVLHFFLCVFFLMQQSTNIDVVRFPCVVYINEVRVIPPGVRAHTSLPDSRAYG